MPRSLLTVTLTALLFVALFAPAAAADDFKLGVGGLASLPISDFDDRYSYGLGAAVYGEHKIIPLLNIAWQGSWLRFQRESDNDFGDDRHYDVFGISAGPQFNAVFFHLGVDGGYFSNVEEFGVVPRLGFRLWLIDVAAEYTWTDKFDWASARLSLVF